jgi:hypothetical protein
MVAWNRHEKYEFCFGTIYIVGGNLGWRAFSWEA